MVRTTPDDEFDHKVLADVANHGWHLVAIADDENGPAYVFSVGMFHTLNHPEICIFGLSDTKVMGQIINSIGDMIRSGQSFEDWQKNNDILEDYSCMFRQVDPSMYREYFGYARWFHEGDNFPMLQCVWPDKSNSYPWDSDFDSGMIQSQPVLATKSAWPFAEAKNLGVFTTKLVLEEAFPIMLVTHDDDGDWQFLCGTTNDSRDARVVCLSDIVNTHPNVSELADLPMGWKAFRNSPDDSWQRAKQD